MTKMSGLLRFGVKAGIMSSAVYLTIDKGVWKDNETTGELYDNLHKTIQPYMKPLIEQIPFDVPKLPKTGDITSSIKTAWNKSVMASCLFLVELPELSWTYIKKGSILTYEKLKVLTEVENEEKKQGEIKINN